MSVYSMTGYGNATIAADPQAARAHSVTVDVRSVNGRFLDLTLKLPDDARGLEAGLRELVSSRVKRGKVELRLTTSKETEGAWPQPSPEQLMQLARLDGMVRGYFEKAAPLSVNEVLQWCRSSSSVAERNDEVTMAAATQALDALVASRQREGARLVQALRHNARQVRELAQQAQPLVVGVVQRQQQRFLDKWREALALAGSGSGLATSASASSGAASNAASAGSAETAFEGARERALSEAAAYALRIDVAEELTRLESHLDELETLLAKGGELGKRLDFLMQELNREANTLGSKSQALELTNLSMAMKVAIEQMREQVQNLE